MTSRIHTPATIADAPAASHSLLEAVRSQLGSVPNLFRMVSNSPAALEGYLGLMGALNKGELSAQTRERIALVVAETNSCDYCLSAHTYLGKKVARLDDSEMAANRAGGSNDAKAAAAVRFAKQVVDARGRVSDADVQAIKAAGYSEAAVLEIVLTVALNIWTNYANHVAGTEIDFPVVHASQA